MVVRAGGAGGAAHPTVPRMGPPRGRPCPCVPSAEGDTGLRGAHRASPSPGPAPGLRGLGRDTCPVGPVSLPVLSVSCARGLPTQFRGSAQVAGGPSSRLVPASSPQAPLSFARITPSSNGPRWRKWILPAGCARRCVWTSPARPRGPPCDGLAGELSVSCPPALPARDRPAPAPPRRATQKGHAHTEWSLPLPPVAASGALWSPGTGDAAHVGI